MSTRVRTYSRAKFLSFLGIISLFDVSQAWADICSYYRRSSPLLYKNLCANGKSSSRPAGAASTLSSSFNLNAASLPSEPSSYGVETIVSRIRGSDGRIDADVGLVKGFSKFGAGLSTASANTFYGDNVLSRLANERQALAFESPEPARGKFSNLNLGTAIKLYDNKKGAGLRLGLSGRYNRITNSWGGGPALLASYEALSLGVGYSRERVSNFLEPVQFMTYQASVKLWVLEFEGLWLTNSVPNLDPIPVGTVTARISRLMVSAAIRRLSTQDGIASNQTHYAVQYLFSKYLSLGAMFNYIPGANSLGVQIYF